MFYREKSSYVNLISVDLKITKIVLVSKTIAANHIMLKVLENNSANLICHLVGG
jgi:hypothetical protein